VPAAHREREGGEQTFEFREFIAMKDELDGHPKRQQCADAVANDL
jgi:hypothetical protein